MAVKSKTGALVGLFASRFVFQRDASDTGTVYPVVAFNGLTEAMTPTFTNEDLEIEDYFFCETMHTETVDSTEAYTASTTNLSPEMQSFYFLADAPTLLEQTAEAKNDLVHSQVRADGIILIEENGTRLYDLASVDAVSADIGGVDTALVEGTDYDVIDLALGEIHIYSGGVITDANANTPVDIKVSVTTNEITGDRLIIPQTSTSIEGKGTVYLRSKCGDQVFAREARFAVKPTGASIQQTGTEGSNLQFEITRIGPAGTLKYIKGTIPKRRPS